MYLKYLFTSLQQNGEYIVQTQEDKSKKTEGRNTFYDILEETKKGNPPIMFCLVCQEARAENDKIINDTYLIDLRDGSFVLNGAKFFLHNTSQKLTNFRLIFYKDRKEHFNHEFAHLSSETIYHLGWQANDENNNNVQVEIKIV